MPPSSIGGILKPSKYAAAPLSEPLIRNDIDSTSSDDDEDSEIEEAAPLAGSDPEPALPDTPMSTKDVALTLTVALLVTGGLAASASALIAYPASAAVILMGGVCIVNSPAVATKHLRIAKSEGVRSSVKKIRVEIGSLKTEIDLVARAVDDLQEEASTLQGVEKALQEITSQQGADASQFVTLVKENQSILDQMRANLKQTFVTAVANIVIQSDRDGDTKIDLKELPLLSLRLTTHLEPLGIELDTKQFEAMLKEDNDISNMLKFCGEVLFDGDSGDYNNSDDNSVDSELTFDFESFCKTLNGEDTAKMTTEERMSMVSIGKKYSQGSVEIARGRKMTLAKTKCKKEVHRKTIAKEAKKTLTKISYKNSSRSTRVTMAGLVILSKAKVQNVRNVAST